MRKEIKNTRITVLDFNIEVKNMCDPKKTENSLLAKATCETIINRPVELLVSDIEINCRLFEVKKIGDELINI